MRDKEMAPGAATSGAVKSDAGGMDAETTEYVLDELRKLRVKVDLQGRVIKLLLATLRRTGILVTAEANPGESGEPAEFDEMLALYELPGFAVGVAYHELDAALAMPMPPDVRRRLRRAIAELRKSQRQWAAWTGYPYRREE